MSGDQVDETPESRSPWARPPEDETTREEPAPRGGVAAAEATTVPAQRGPDPAESHPPTTPSGTSEPAEPAPPPPDESAPVSPSESAPAPPGGPAPAPRGESAPAPEGEPAPAPPVSAAAPVRRWPAWDTRTRIVVAASVAVVALLALLGGYYLHERSLRTVQLLGADERGGDPFGPDLALEGTVIPTQRFDPATNRTPAGGLDGLYFDTSGTPACNRAELDGQLRGRPELARAWAAPLGIDGGGAPAYLAALTPVRLRADTRVTAYGYAGDKAEPYAATLQAGSAVLVDDRGVPRVHCADSAPLSGPRPVAEPYYGGSEWSGFDPAVQLEVRPAPTGVREFGLVDPTGQGAFRRPSGSAGDHDLAQLSSTGRLAEMYVLSGPETRCEGFTTCQVNATRVQLPRFDGCPGSCTVSNVGPSSAPISLVKDGDTWRAKADGNFVQCGTTAVPGTIRVSYTPTRSEVVDGVWQATELKGEFELLAPPAGGCVPSVRDWSLSGRGGS